MRVIPSRVHARLLQAAFFNDLDNVMGGGYGVLYLRTPGGLVDYWRGLDDGQRAAVEAEIRKAAA
jgi:hypothetical protein